jgi:hypothetical protein
MKNYPPRQRLHSPLTLRMGVMYVMNAVGLALVLGTPAENVLFFI